MNPLRAYLALVRWDWLREMKRKETVASMVLFSLVTLVIFSFALPPTSESGVRARAGVLWVTYLLAGSIGIERAFSRESTVLQGVLLSPVGRSTVYYARITSTFLYVLVMEILAFVAFLILYNVPLSVTAAAKVLLGVLTATLGFVAAGVTLAAMMRAVRGGEVLLRLLLFPLLVPLFYAVVRWTQLALDGDPPGTRALWILASFDLVYVAAGQILFEVVVTDFET